MKMQQTAIGQRPASPRDLPSILLLLTDNEVLTCRVRNLFRLGKPHAYSRRIRAALSSGFKERQRCIGMTGFDIRRMRMTTMPEVVNTAKTPRDRRVCLIRSNFRRLGHRI